MEKPKKCTERLLAMIRGKFTIRLKQNSAKTKKISSNPPRKKPTPPLHHRRLHRRAREILLKRILRHLHAIEPVNLPLHVRVRPLIRTRALAGPERRKLPVALLLRRALAEVQRATGGGGEFDEGFRACFADALVDVEGFVDACGGGVGEAGEDD